MKDKMFNYLNKDKKTKQNRKSDLCLDLRVQIVLETGCVLMNIQQFACTNTNLHVAENISWPFSEIK